MSKKASALGSFLLLMVLYFITFKLVHIIDWSWWWIFSPLWIPVGLFVFMLLVAVSCSVAIEQDRGKRS